MEGRKILFPQIRGMLHGGDYNPEQWLDRVDILEEDVRLMKRAHINCVTLGVFSWAAYERTEGAYDVSWLKACMDRLYENGIYTILATPSGAKPAWLASAYPESLRVDAYGVRARHGGRHNHCCSSPAYREKVEGVVTRLAEEVGGHPGLLMWHISNEFGGECFCPLCVARFQSYLERKFEGDIEKLNHAWWTAFWSHSYSSFAQVEPPFSNGEYSIQGLNLEWRRFTTENTRDYLRFEIGLVNRLTPGKPVTTNFMELYEGLDYRVLADDLDVISWDCYPRFHNDEETFAETMAGVAFDHAVMRSMKKETPFLMMESAPGLVNWQEFNKLKRPGVHALASLQAVACGSDSVQYFQWRKSRGCMEQYHGAVVGHLGLPDARVFREVAALGASLEKLSAISGSLVRSQAALLFDWDTMWALADMQGLGRQTKQYAKTCEAAFRAFTSLGVDMDVIPQEGSFDGYQVIVAPMLYVLKPGVADRLKRFVERGGQLLATYVTGYVNEHLLCFLGGFPGGGLQELFGVISEEIDTLYPKDENTALFSDGTAAAVKDYAELLRVQGAEVLGVYGGDFYQGTAAVTVNAYGAGKAYYVGARISPEKMTDIYRRMLEDAGVPARTLPEGVECHVRSAEGKAYEFFLNMSEEEKEISEAFGKDLLTGREALGGLRLLPYGAAVLEQEIS